MLIDDGALLGFPRAAELPCDPIRLPCGSVAQRLHGLPFALCDRPSFVIESPLAAHVQESATRRLFFVPPLSNRSVIQGLLFESLQTRLVERGLDTITYR